MTIRLITLKTAHTLMGNVEEESDHIIIKEPVQVVQIPPKTKDEPENIAFSPFLHFTEDFKVGIKLYKIDILTVTTPVMELENQYNLIFGSGIQIAKTLT
jgi:hypothetical protein